MVYLGEDAREALLERAQGGCSGDHVAGGLTGRSVQYSGGSEFHPQ